MRTVVLDASALARFYLGDGPVTERLSGAFRDLERGEAVFLGPDILLVEVAQVLRKRVATSVLSRDDAEALLAVWCSLRIRWCPTVELAPMALRRAIETGLTVYDAIYLSLAERHGADLLTCDAALARAAEVAVA
jgi:predicted nucleic acid-binding protein